MKSGILILNKHYHILPHNLLPASDVRRSPIFTEVLKCPHYIKHVTAVNIDISAKFHKIFLLPMHKKETQLKSL